MKKKLAESDKRLQELSEQESENEGRRRLEAEESEKRRKEEEEEKERRSQEKIASLFDQGERLKAQLKSCQRQLAEVTFTSLIVSS